MKVKMPKIDGSDVALYALIALLMVVIGLIVGPTFKETAEYNQWYNSLSAEEKLEVYQSNISTYEVLGVAKYVRVETNSRGGVMDTDICYAFEYIDGDGNFKSVDNFEHLEGGLTKVAVGEVDAYIINSNGETTRTLQLTKETFKNIQTLSSG